MNPSEIQGTLARLGASPTKSKGQNFLVDGRVADRQIEYAQLSSSDTALEVGPGLGVLTSRLAARAGKVIAIETDSKLAAYLRDELPENVELIEGDALEVPFPPFTKFVSNLPYSISSPIIFKLLEHGFQRGVVMLQKEFAERMVAAPDTDDYSRLTVNVFYRAECRILENGPPLKVLASAEGGLSHRRAGSPPIALPGERRGFLLPPGGDAVPEPPQEDRDGAQDARPGARRGPGAIAVHGPAGGSPGPGADRRAVGPGAGARGRTTVMARPR